MAKAAVQTYRAGAKFVRISPYKVREVAAIIKGQHVDEARRILAFTPKAASFEISKILESAIANAEHNFQVPQEELFVRNASADEGVTIKRFRPRAQGRGFRIRKRTSHINLELERRIPEQEARPTRTRKTAAAAPAKGGAKAASSKPASKPATKKAAAKPATKKAAAKPAAKKSTASTAKESTKAASTEKKAPAKRSTKTKEGN